MGVIYKVNHWSSDWGFWRSGPYDSVDWQACVYNWEISWHPLTWFDCWVIDWSVLKTDRVENGSDNMPPNTSQSQSEILFYIIVEERKDFHLLMRRWDFIINMIDVLLNGHIRRHFPPCLGSCERMNRKYHCRASSSAFRQKHNKCIDVSIQGPGSEWSDMKLDARGSRGIRQSQRY